MAATPEAEIVQMSGTQDDPQMNFDPHEKIEDFEWQDLEQRFHQEMEKCGKQELKLYEDLTELFNVIHRPYNGHVKLIHEQALHCLVSGDAFIRTRTDIKAVSNMSLTRNGLLTRLLD